MAAFHGKVGTVSFEAETFLNVVNWSMNITSDLAESTAMGLSWKTYLAGFKDWTGSAEVLMDHGGLLATAGSTALAQIGTAAACIFVASSVIGAAVTFTANGFLTDFTINDPSDGVVTMTLTFQGSGSVA